MAISIDGSANTIAGITSLPDLAVGGVPDGTIDADALAADCIDESKIANNGIDSEHYNAGSVDLSHLSATGTASSSTFLRGDNAWAAVTDTGKILSYEGSSQFSRTTGSGTTYADAGIQDTITTTVSGSKILFIVSYMWKVDSDNQGHTNVSLRQQLLRSNDGFSSNSVRVQESRGHVIGASGDIGLSGHTCFASIDSPAENSGTTLTYKLQARSAWESSDLWEIASDVQSGVYGSRSITLLELAV